MKSETNATIGSRVAELVHHYDLPVAVMGNTIVTECDGTITRLAPDMPRKQILAWLEGAVWAAREKGGEDE